MSIDTNEQNGNIIKKSCQRFKSQSDIYYDFECDKAITYLKLRSEGCDKKIAAQFSSKPFCRIDTTRLKFGPSN